MSDITDVYTALQTRLAAIYPNHRRLTNPYKIDQNAETNLFLGYGVQVLPGENSKRNISCKISIQRTFLVILVRKFRSLELDRIGKETTEKALLEDQFLLIKDIESDPNLGVPTIVARAEWLNDGGISFVFGDKDSYMKLENTVEVEYFEDLN